MVQQEAFVNAVQLFAEANRDFANFIRKFNLHELNNNQIKSIYLHLSEYILHPKWTEQLAELFRSDLLNILSLSVDFDQLDNIKSENVLVRSTIALGILLNLHPDSESFVVKYFAICPSPFSTFEVHKQPQTKITKTTCDYVVSDLDIAKSCLTFLQKKPDFFKTKWEWSDFFQKFCKHDNAEIRWLAAHCLAIYLGLNENSLKSYLKKSLSEEEIIENELKYSVISFQKTLKFTNGSEPTQNVQFTAPNVVNIGGILLPTHKKPEKCENLVQVESTQKNLHKLALGVATCKPINLLGPVGSGKTTLVEYLAAKTGRQLGESFIKIQLGDQTDSKMLLGTYRCTDIPGEFVWQPGVLTQAVLEGSWLLLEDIDSASMDIASVLSGLIENQYLTVPGFRDFIPIAPGFQMFTTQRLVTTITGHHKKYSNATSLLEKHVLSVNIEPLTYAELQEIITVQYTCLKTVASRMVEVFKRFMTNQSRNSRLCSTRDLFKWCARAIVDFDVSSQQSALYVLQNAIDIFCCSYSDLDERLRLAQDICTHLGIVNEKAKYFCLQYQPTLDMSSNSDEATLSVGRGSLLRRDIDRLTHDGNFCFTRASACLLERIICCVNMQEPVLLVGETGTGKTSTVQFIANRIGQKLVVINMNQQSDSADLLGGYKPVDMKLIIAPIKKEFELCFCSFFNPEANRKFLTNLNFCFNEKQWVVLVKLMKKCYEAALKRLKHVQVVDEAGSKRKLDTCDTETSPKIIKDKDLDNFNKWSAIGVKLIKLEAQLKHKSALAFAFIEGSLVKAIKNGYWVLLDEINLANAETLECLSGLLEGSKGTLSLLERGDKKPIQRDPNFMLFACMNPSTDIGKKDLPVGLRNRFTEFFVEELTDRNDLIKMVNKYFEAMRLQEGLENIVQFYLTVRKEAVTSLSDGLGHKPHFSLRSLCRALTISAKNPCGTFKRSLYEAFCLSFLTQLDSPSYARVEQMISKYMVPEKSQKYLLKEAIPAPKAESGENLQFEGYWIEKGRLEPHIMPDYILTKSVRGNLKDLVRIVSIGRLPVLLQGDTSVGKTSLITYLARAAGYKCVRINNHEHTDLQEYIGSYVASEDGKLEFREGLLVDAMRQGHWIILDELNLAPSDVLEALNRVLDDNRELFIPETQQTIKAHPNFMLFATQNPPGLYGGRKMLSRAFRNRFVELHFNEIPHVELEFILHKRCQMPESYARKMISVMKDLQTRRRQSAAFAGKHGFITLRDLFRWGERYHLALNPATLYDWDQHLADEGYLLLAGRVRKPEEREEIALVLKKHLKRTVVPENLFSLSEDTSTVTRVILEKIMNNKDKHGGIVWTFNMRQLAVLVGKALEFHEPVLLVGETGGGKTTVCNILAQNNGQHLVTVNCHMHTESSDFIGALRPVRDHASDEESKLFEWVYGPLVRAMEEGNLFLADEISLADDSVLERLNSLLEPERTLLIAEKGSGSNELIRAHAQFHFIGTMNPGGDFGKKELSPALRNRFTEIWCETCSNRQDLIDIIEYNVRDGLRLHEDAQQSGIGVNVIDFIDWFKNQEIGKRFTISIRDILTWVHFINTCSGLGGVGAPEAYLHGACLTFLDSLGSGVTSMETPTILKTFEKECLNFIKNQLKVILVNQTMSVESLEDKFGITPFFVECGNELANSAKGAQGFSFEAPTTINNALRILRGLQLKKALLLEGSPGVGKTSLVTALAKASRNKIFRINLSDQTDISDLFGADLPVEGGKAGQFAWRDGPLLQALKQGHWILLDELNLASQSVLEGLNACLDHRGEIFIPELGKMFYVKPGTRFFGCQNPLKQGGSRRGLPQSFLNRFTQVYLCSLSNEDLSYILDKQFPHLPAQLIARMVDFNFELNAELDRHTFGYRGAPWEFNLRDLTRWCEATIFHERHNRDGYKPQSSVELLFVDRMRTREDKEHVLELFKRVFQSDVGGVSPVCYVTELSVILGDVTLPRNGDQCCVSVMKQDETCLLLRQQLPVLRSLAYCVNMNWMSILVGPASCGKSSVVKTLAKLTGRTLRTLAVTSAMDTTDILGGFEQADYTRHLDELSTDFERTLIRIIQRVYVNGAGSEEIGLQCMRMWEKFIVVFRDATKSSTMAEETRNFIAKLQRLDAILNRLIKIAAPNAFADFQDELSLLKQRVLEISQHVEREESLNAGGKFEWVDSVLIKCLKEGSWLLVDNVNLCSPAVLDRLNALLEPHGVLTIGERGVDEDGKMISVKPHPNFRLFLTMDPKNGEISRAMRNRGVEIFMLEKCNGVFDTKSLVAKQGLTNGALIDALITLHEFITEIVQGEKPTISQLIHASFLIAQQLHRGTRISQAFETTIVDVYLNTKCTSEFITREALVNKIGELLSATINENGNSSNQITLRTKALESNSQLALVEQQATLLLGNSQNLQCMDAGQFSVIHFFTHATLQDLQLRLDYFRRFSNNEFPCELFDQCIRAADFTNTQLPIDERWLPDTQYANSDVSKCNKIFLHLYYDVYRATATKSDKSSQKGFTLLQYLSSVRRKEVDTKIDDPVLKDILLLCDQYDRFVQHLLAGNGVQLSNADTCELLELFEHRFQLYQYLRLELRTVDEIADYIVNVHVHYKWFVKHSVKEVLALLNLKEAHDMEDLTTTIETVNAQLTNHFNVLKKLGKHYQKVLIKKPPLVNSTQLQLLQKIHRELDMLDICNPKLDPKETIKALKVYRTIAMQLKKHLTFDFHDEINYLNFDLSNLQQIPQEELNVLSVFDYFSLLQVINLRNSHTFNDLTYLESALTVPVKLSSVLQQYQQDGDTRLMHEMIIETHHYLHHATALNQQLMAKCDADKDKVIDKIALHMPVLSYLISQVFLDVTKQNGVGNSTFGNYREVASMSAQVNKVLWNNLKQLSHEDFDLIQSEKKYLQSSLKNFLQDFAKCLNIDNGNLNDQELLQHCKRALIMLYEQKQSAPVQGLDELLVLQELLALVIEKFEQLPCTKAENADLDNIADCYILLNYLKLLLNAKLPSIDPLSKVTMKKHVGEQAKNQFEQLCLSFEQQNEVATGNEHTLHPLHPLAAAKCYQLQEKLHDLGKYIAARPKEVEYQKLIKMIYHGFTTILSPQKILASYKSISALVAQLLASFASDLERCQRELRLAHATLTSFDNFLEGIKPYRHIYPDVIEALLSDVMGFLHGFRLKCSLLKKLVMMREHRQLGVNVEQVLMQLVKLPMLSETRPTHIELVKNNVGEEMHRFIVDIFKDDAFIDANKETFALLKSGFIEMSNICRVNVKYTNVFDAELFNNFNALVEQFVNAWKTQQAEMEIKKNADESLYKTRTKCDDKSEEEQAEHDFKQLFPSYHEQDFRDLLVTDLTDDPEDPENHMEYAGVIRQEDIETISKLHTQIMFAFTRTEWLNPSKTNADFTCDFITPQMYKFKLFKQLLEKTVHCLSYKMDRELIGSFSILLAIAQNFGNINTLNDVSVKYNFYKHSNVDEVKSSFHILKELEKKINELLDEWPEHPTLKTILTIITRILNFDITSPLPRFLTGFDILLTKCHEWEENAHSGVSLSMHFAPISHQLIAWRKLEMTHWKASLDNVVDKMTASTYKFWFILYDIMREFIHEKLFDTTELIASLQRFILQSNIAEFGARLRLLYAFHCHATYLAPSIERDMFVSILWNLYKHYEQFIPTVSQQIRTLRTPIEKKLKDYVKIVRWRDISYWALKETLEKTHKIIHKYMREFESALKQPSSQNMTNVQTSYERPTTKEIAHIKKDYYNMDLASYVSKIELKCLGLESIGSTLLTNTATYCKKMKNLCLNIFKLSKYSSLIKELDYFIGQVIENSKYLQGLEVDRSVEKEKQVSQAKGHLRQKQRALSDLFKALAKIGLSFRKGIIESKQKSADLEYLVKPLDLKASLGHLTQNANDAQLVQAWESVEIYYRKAFMRLEILEYSLKTPAKDLGIQNIERCKGFAKHLMNLSTHQKMKLIQTSNQLYTLRYLFMIINQAQTNQKTDKFVALDKVQHLQSVLISVVHTIKELKLVLHSVPDESLEENALGLPLLNNIKQIDFIRNKTDENWHKATENLDKLLKIVESVLLTLRKTCSENFVPVTNNTFGVSFPKFLVFHQEINNNLLAIISSMKEISDFFNNIEMVSAFNYLIQQVENSLFTLLNPEEIQISHRIKDIPRFKRDIRKLVEASLLSIQNIAEKYIKEASTTPTDVTLENEEDLQVNHLTIAVIGNLTTDLDCLNMTNLFNRLNILVETVCDTNMSLNHEYQELLDFVNPFLDQIINLYQFLVTQQVSSYRVTAKMTSVMLNIFIDLATKGFCVPPDLESDVQGESKMSSGLGLGEGEGERDVSDRIESEDQLEDAQPAGQEKQNEDKDCKEEEKGIEMSDDFDSKLQDVEKKPDDDEENSDDDKDSNAEEQMGDTDKDAEQLDKQIWGSDDEAPEEEQDGKEEEKGDSGEKEGENQMTAKDEQTAQDDNEQDKDGKEEKEQKQKDINEMDEPEYDDEQTDPYHGNQPELPEPEEMDLPDDLQLDSDGEQEEQNEENPFDIDAMKEQIPEDVPNPEETGDKPEVENDQQNPDDSESDEDGAENKEQDGGTEELEDKSLETEENDEGKKQKDAENPEEDDEQAPETNESVYDQTQSHDNNAQAMDVDDATAADNVELNPNEQQKSAPTTDETAQEDNPDKEGVGQSQMEKSKTGHKGEANAKQDSRNKERDTEEKKRNRPGETDSERCLGDNTEPVKKKMKTIDAKTTEDDNKDEENDEEQDADVYKHIKEAKESSMQVMDAVTKDQAEKLKEQQVPTVNEEEQAEEATESQDQLPDDKDEETFDEELLNAKQKAEKIENEKKQKLEQHKAKGDVMEEMTEMDVDGDVIETHGVSRSTETTYHTQYLSNEAPTLLSIDDMNQLRTQVEQQLSIWNSVPSKMEAEQAWEKISSLTSSLAQELSEQLRLVLEPTQASRLKGDFRTGRRINMRKVIPYIASQFRKDKIWLRRTKPSKREYQIVLAIDDSSSMADNHSKELAFESVALISKALNLLESGQLSILSFGESTRILHKLTDTFTEKSGSSLLQQFQFDQQKTCVAKLVDFATEMLNSAPTTVQSLLAKLLIIVSDGRGIFSEGESYVQQAVRRAKLDNVFMIFVIIDNPENKSSILDIRKPVFHGGKIMEIKSYMDAFPFPFYIILKDINALPSVLSDALRQWFEVVSNVDRH